MIKDLSTRDPAVINMLIENVNIQMSYLLLPDDCGKISKTIFQQVTGLS